MLAKIVSDTVVSADEDGHFNVGLCLKSLYNTDDNQVCIVINLEILKFSICSLNYVKKNLTNYGIASNGIYLVCPSVRKFLTDIIITTFTRIDGLYLLTTLCYNTKFQ